jgi:hypothetical protein
LKENKKSSLSLKGSKLNVVGVIQVSLFKFNGGKVVALNCLGMNFLEGIGLIDESESEILEFVQAILSSHYIKTNQSQFQDTSLHKFDTNQSNDNDF